MVSFWMAHIVMQPSFKSDMRLWLAAPSYVEAESQGSLFEAAGSFERSPLMKDSTVKVVFFIC